VRQYDRVQDFLPARLQDILRDSIYNGFYAELMDQVASDLDQFDALGSEPFLVFFEPPSLDARIVNQFGLFSALSDPSGKPDLALDSWLYKRHKPGKALFKKVVIPAELKWEVRDKLDGANINERMLFPGLDGLSTWLERHYSCSP